MSCSFKKCACSVWLKTNRPWFAIVTVTRVLALSFALWVSLGVEVTDCTSSPAHTGSRSNSVYPRTLKLRSVAQLHSRRLVMENENHLSCPAEFSSGGVAAWRVWGHVLYVAHAAALQRFIMQLEKGVLGKWRRWSASAWCGSQMSLS